MFPSPSLTVSVAGGTILSARGVCATAPVARPASSGRLSSAAARPRRRRREKGRAPVSARADEGPKLSEEECGWRGAAERPPAEWEVSGGEDGGRERSRRRHAPDALMAGDPATRRPGDPATRRPGDPATRRPGDPATRRPGDPATRRPGDPATRRPGDPATRRPGDPATRRPGDPATRRPGDPATRRPGDHYSRGVISVCQPRIAHRRNGGAERSPSPVHISDHGPVSLVCRGDGAPQGRRTPSIAQWSSAFYHRRNREGSA